MNRYRIPQRLAVAVPCGITGAILGQGWPFPALSPLLWLAIPFWGLAALVLSFFVWPPLEQGEKQQIPASTEEKKPERTLCRWRPEGVSTYLCDRSQWSESPDGFCLYHAPENARHVHTVRQVWETVERRLEQGIGDFIGWHIPQCPSGMESIFSHATRECPIDFSWAVFGGQQVFDHTEFRGGARFAMAKFLATASFRGCRFPGEAVFTEAVFAKEADFSGTEFRDAMFTGSRFGGNAVFVHTVFELGADFSYTVFRGVTMFARTVAKPGATVVFPLPNLEVPFVVAKPFELREFGREPYGVAASAATMRGAPLEAGTYHYASQCAAEYDHRRTWGWKPWSPRFWLGCLELLFGRWVFGYGEKPFRVLLVGLLVILTWAGACWGRRAVVPNGATPHELMLYAPGAGGPTFRECLHFSVVTFTTLGYGDLVPRPGCRWLADVEAVLGAGLMALFIVGLARRYTR